MAKAEPRRNSQHRDWWVFRYRRMRLQRPADGKVYQERWGLEVGPAHRKGETEEERAARGRRSWGRVYLHRFDAPDPGRDVHDHPWVMTSVVLKGAYTERLYDVRFGPPPGWHKVGGDRLRRFASLANERHPSYRSGRWHRMGLDRAHRIIDVVPGTWTVMFGGPYRRAWGFYVEDSRAYIATAPGTGWRWIDHKEYERTVRAERRDLASVQGLLRP